MIPNRVVKIRQRDKPGFTTQVRKLYKQVHKLHKRKIRTGNPEHIQQYINKRKEAKETFRRAKQAHFDKLSHDILTNTNNPKTYWKLS